MNATDQRRSPRTGSTGLENAVRGNASHVRIPSSPPFDRPDWCLAIALCPAACRCAVVDRAQRSAILGPGRPPAPAALSLPGRARRGTSGALYLQSAPAGLNSPSRSSRSEAAAPGDVEDRVPRSGESRTVSGPEGSSTQRSSSGAAERPGPSRLRQWARASVDRRGVHGNNITVGRRHHGAAGSSPGAS
jgi:hypothetical protein